MAPIFGSFTIIVTRYNRYGGVGFFIHFTDKGFCAGHELFAADVLADGFADEVRYGHASLAGFSL